MRLWTVLLLYLVWVFVGAGALAPALWWLAHGLADWTGANWASALADHPFHRYVSRCVQVLALVGMVPFARALGCRGAADLGWHREPHWFQHLGVAGGLGLASFLAALALELGLGWREWRLDLGLGLVLRRALGGVVAGVAVALAEETLFRGLLLGALRRVTGDPIALAISTLIYAAVHFLERSSTPAVVEMGSGWVAVGQMFAGFGAADRLVPRFFTLLTAGAAMGWWFWRTGGLHGAVALHATWVLGIKLRGGLTRAGEGEWHSRGSDWVALASALVVLALTIWVLRHRGAGRQGEGRTREESGAESNQRTVT
ncbi:MAG: CPBP family intramembrane metalloprotease [Verrucomicrobiales bacterium]|nr:CPBP family intramembrane metalloprotease [Verrucomicrobiales bacterium]